MNRTNTTFAAVVATDKRYESFTLVILMGSFYPKVQFPGILGDLHNLQTYTYLYIFWNRFIQKMDKIYNLNALEEMLSPWNCSFGLSELY